MNVKKTQQQEKGEDDYSLESLRIFQHDYFPDGKFFENKI